MLDAELVIHPLGTRGTESSVLVALGVEVASKLLVGGSGDDALFIQKCKDASVLAINEIKNVLIIRERNELPKDALAFVFILLQLEHVLVELLLKSLVGVINANLLKVVRRLARLFTLDFVKGTMDDLIACPDGTIRQCIGQILKFDTEQPCGRNR